VYIRCRPLQSKELLEQQFKTTHTHHSHKCVSVAPNSGSQKVLVQGTNKEFVFDRIFDEDAGQLSLFRATVEHLLPDCFRGINLTLLAYGQTGSGKTHTMGSSVGLLNTEDEGLIPRVLRAVFDRLAQEQQAQEQEPGRVTNLRLSFVEIYNEEIRDLLHPEVPSKDIGLREDAQGRIFFVGAREEAVSSLGQAFSFLDKGCLSRTTGDTLMNATSSRSHAIFTINIEVFDSQQHDQDVAVGGDDDEESGQAGTALVHSYTQAKISLVDLAGSERAKRTGASGTRLKESVGINQGLLSLGKVIRALTSSSHTSGASSFVPYRESKLTRYLQDSLGGNSRTLMFACVSKSNADLHETLTTLQYAMRARAVQNKIVANVMVAPASNLSSLMEDSVVEALRRQLTHLQAQLQASDSKDACRDQSSALQLQMNCKSQADKDALMDQLSGVQDTISNGVLFFDEELEKGSISLSRPAMMEELELRLSDLHNTLATLEEVRGKLVLAPPVVGVSGHVSDGQSSDQSRVIQALESELRECKEDLQRDEEIFSEKVNELNRFRRLLRQNQEERNRLDSEVGHLTRKVHELQSQLNAVQAKAQSTDHENEEDDDLLDVSLAVAATEPHISQLMEDLELVNREKEALSGERDLAEQKYSQAKDLAQQQKDDFDNSRRNLHKELKHLEIGIKMKEECIRTITSEQKAIASKADLFELRIADLEKERSELAMKLQQQKEQAVKTESTEVTVKAGGERHTTQEAKAVQQYQRKLQRVQDEISAMRSEWSKENKKSESKQSSAGDVRRSVSDDLLTDLQVMKDEHRRLLSMMTESENSQKEKVGALLVELEGYKQASQVSQQHISQLEAKNASLRDEIRQHITAKPSSTAQQEEPALLLPPPPNANSNMQIPHTTLSGQKEGYLIRHKSNTNYQEPPNSLVPDNFLQVEDIDRPLDQGEVRSAWEWLNSRMAAQLSEMAVEEEKEDSKLKLATITEEEQSLESELAALEARQQQGAASLARHCDDMDMKIAATQTDLVRGRAALRELQEFLDDIRVEQKQRRLLLKEAYSENASQLQEELEGLEMQQLQLQIELDDEQNKLKADEVLLKRYKEHKLELQARVERGVLKESDANRVTVIKDELEALGAERQLYSSTRSAVSGGRGRDEALCQTELLRDIVRLTRSGGKQSGSREEGLGGALSFLVSAVLDEKVRNEKVLQEVKEQELMLNEKSEEFEQLALVLHRTRSDLGQKVERQKKEYEDKVAFLLMQLRTAELQAQSNSTLLRKSFEAQDGTGSGRRIRGQRPSATTSQDDGDQGRISSSALGYVRPRPHTAQSYTATQSSNSRDTTKEEGDVQELLRKYHGEKERREVLEKRNGELARELRALRKEISSKASMGDSGSHPR